MAMPPPKVINPNLKNSKNKVLNVFMSLIINVSIS
jgi:hypothetical protein